jgi:ABC-type sugar transport system substrate-binding protein
MPKIITAGLTALFIAASPLAYAQAPAPDRTAELKAFTDARIEIVKLALQLTPAQEKFWPAVEEAIRARANARHARLMALAAQANEDRERTPIEVLRAHADGLAQRAANLRKLVDAWQPLYESLDTRQKLRLRFVTVMALREMKDAAASRFWESEDEDEYE